MVAGDPVPAGADPVDPVRARRRRIGRLAGTGKRIGYALFGVAIVAFVVGAASGFPGATVTIVVGSLAVGSAVLAPAIVVAYGVRAAEREDGVR
jgi:cytochrome c biogenesis protein ResB